MTAGERLKPQEDVTSGNLGRKNGNILFSQHEHNYLYASSAISNITRHTLHEHEQIALGQSLITAGWHGKTDDNWKHATRQHNLPYIAKALSWRVVSKDSKHFEQSTYFQQQGILSSRYFI
jgi:hypothetical protein